jgi:hypothetical protein
VFDVVWVLDFCGSLAVAAEVSFVTVKRVLTLAALGCLSCVAWAQVPYVFGYNPGPSQGTKWMAKASDGAVESSAAVLMEAPRPVWSRVCYSIGPSDSTVTVYAQNRQGDVRATDLAWGGCADVFGTSIWIGNPHEQVVGGYYGVAPATPSE